MTRRARPVELTSEEKRFDFRRWVLSHMVVESRGDVEWTCRCPSCGRPKLAVNVDRKAWQCWSASCRFRGWRPVALVAAVLEVHPIRAAEIIAADVMGVVMGPVGPLSVPETASLRLPMAYPPPGTIWELTGREREYALSRGISADHIRMFGLSSVARVQDGSKANRLTSGSVLFPVWDELGQFVFWTVRVTWGSIKTLNLPAACKDSTHPIGCTCRHDEWGLPGVPDVAGKEDVVLGLHLIQPGDRVVIVEGPVDAAVCGPGFVATMGATLSWRQALLIAGTGAREAVVLYDPDDAGRSGARSAHALLSSLMPTRVAECPDGMDPGDLGRDGALSVVDLSPRKPSVAGLGVPSREPNGVLRRQKGFVVELGDS